MKTSFRAIGSQSGSKHSGLRNLLLAVGAMCILSSGVLLAARPFDDDAPASPTQPTPDARAVRLSSAEGQVRVVQDGQVIADPATANLPLFEGSQITTGNDGRAEVQLENGSIARLSPNSALTFTVLKQQGSGSRTEIVLNGGLAYFELQPSTADHSLRVSYGPATFTASSFSVVRLRLDTPPGELAVFSGNVHLERGDALQLDVHGGESLTLASSDLTRYNLAESIEPDSWDSWNADRDQVLNTETGEKTAATVNSNAIGTSDLDANGNWYDVPGQGYVWSPYDAQAQGANWDPYGYGQWVSYPAYGYVWASGYPWGYLPYQCGLWNYYNNFGWGWAPGGGCNPWWQTGGWGYGIGNGFHGYHPPHRPMPGPGQPRPVRFGGQTLRAASVIQVDRRQSGTATNMAMYARPTQPVTIAGHPVVPLQPVTPRATYDHPASSMAMRPTSGYGTTAHPTYSYTGNSYAYHPSQSASRPAPSYASHAQSSAASAPHSSFSGGGGGGAMAGGGGHAVSAGGGGGGGGGTHK
jgi:hypothetical protein